MQTALKIEMLKTKSSTYLKTALVLPCIFLVFTLMTMLFSKHSCWRYDHSVYDLLWNDSIRD